MSSDQPVRSHAKRSLIALFALATAVAVWAYARRDMNAGMLPSLSDPIDESLVETGTPLPQEQFTLARGSERSTGAPSEFAFERKWTYAATPDREAEWKALQSLVGKQAPEFKVAEWSLGATPAKEPGSLKGKIVLIDFWATWCKPCKDAIPHTNAVADKFRDRGVVVVGVCCTRGSDKMTQTAQRHKMKYPSARDIDNATSGAYDVQWWPFYVLVDREGKIRAAGLAPNAISIAVERLLDSESKPG